VNIKSWVGAKNKSVGCVTVSIICKEYYSKTGRVSIICKEYYSKTGRVRSTQDISEEVLAL
jgi:hypothetical protein